MAKSVEAILSKLDRPPAGHNFARSNFQSLALTTSALVNLAMGFPQVSYRWAIDVIQAQLADKLDNGAALKLLAKNCPPSQLDDNLELLRAFQEYNDTRCFDGLPVFPEFCGQFMAGADVKIPIKPTALLREGGAIKPLFVIGWAANGLKYYQRRLLTSMYEDAIYSLTDLRASSGEVLIFPRNGYGKRTVERWYRDTYQRLSHDELREQVERFVVARSAARPIIVDRVKEREAKKRGEEASRRKSPPGSPLGPEDRRP
jgi:hypothetical protein